MEQEDSPATTSVTSWSSTYRYPSAHSHPQPTTTSTSYNVTQQSFSVYLPPHPPAQHVSHMPSHSQASQQFSVEHYMPHTYQVPCTQPPTQHVSHIPPPAHVGQPQYMSPTGQMLYGQPPTQHVNHIPPPAHVSQPQYMSPTCHMLYGQPPTQHVSHISSPAHVSQPQCMSHTHQLPFAQPPIQHVSHIPSAHVSQQQHLPLAYHLLPAYPTQHPSRPSHLPHDVVRHTSPQLHQVCTIYLDCKNCMVDTLNSILQATCHTKHTYLSSLEIIIVLTGYNIRFYFFCSIKMISVILRKVKHFNNTSIVVLI